MAHFETTGFDGLELSLEELADIPESVFQEMLMAEGEIFADAQRKKIREIFPEGTGTLEKSIKVHKKLRSTPSSKGFVRYVLVYPDGIHGSYNRKLVKKTYKRSKHGRTYDVGGDVKEVTNNDVGFIHEFGAPKKGIPAKQWMRTANEECADEAVGAAANVYSNWLDGLGL